MVTPTFEIKDDIQHNIHKKFKKQTQQPNNQPHTRDF